MKKYLMPSLVAILLSNCTPSPQSISFGSDACYSCKMTIVDKQHASQVVTKKGKAFMFDAIECMIPYVLENNENDFTFILVNDYTQPETLIDARAAHYLVCEKIPSPMGEFLSAFSDPLKAEEVAGMNGGQVYDWEKIKLKFNLKYSNLN